jgi:DNA-directed RNA polymerase subunit K/omega
MSDDETYEEAYEEGIGEVEEPEFEEERSEVEKEEQSDEEAEKDLEIEAAGTDESSSESEEMPVVSASRPAKPEKARVDPLLRASNKPRIVHIVADDDRMTDSRLQKTEAAAALAYRAKQIASFSTRFVESGDLHDPGQIAFKELYARRCPLKIRREVGTTPTGDLIVEEWKVSEMTLPPQSAMGMF